jgi:hypothetical protein
MAQDNDRQASLPQGSAQAQAQAALGGGQPVRRRGTYQLKISGRTRLARIDTRDAPRRSALMGGRARLLRAKIARVRMGM